VHVNPLRSLSWFINNILWAIKVPTPVNYRFFASKVQWDFRNWTFINVHFWISQNTFGKSNICEHNEKLASHARKKIKNFVMLIFLFFGADSLGDFFMSIY
jgi:hypothetical protein